MRKFFIKSLAIIALTVTFILIVSPLVFSSGEANIPVTWWYKAENWIKDGSWTATNKTLTNPTITTGIFTNPTVTTGTFTSPTIISPTLNDYTGTTILEDLKLGHSVIDSLGRVLGYVQNKNGSALALGDVVAWDNASVVVVADAAPAASATIANNLSAEGGFRTLSLACTGTPDAGDSVVVYGTNYESGASDITAMLLPATLNVVFMVTDSSDGSILHWSKIDSIKYNADAVADGASAITVNSYGISTVIACDGANTDIAGVVIGAIADNAFGYVVTHGVCLATVDAGTNAASPGVLLEGAANGDFVVDAAGTTGKNAARALEYSTADNTIIRVFVDSF